MTITRPEIRLAVFRAYGSTCSCCEEHRDPFLTIDHVDGGGTAHRVKLFGKKNSAGQTFYKYLFDNGFPNDPELQVLCANCNIASANGRCPHEARSVPGARTSDAARTKRQAMDRYGEVCYCCSEAALPFLSLDHVNRDGAEHRRRLAASGMKQTTGEHFYRYLRRNEWPNDPPLRVACHNCNTATAGGGACPHQKGTT